MTLPTIRTHRPHPRYALAALACVAGLAAAATPATAQGPIPPNNGGATEYIPPAPDPGGDRPSGPGAHSNPGSLPPRVRAALPSGAEGRALVRFATSPGYGAPSANGASGSGAKGNGSGGGSTAGDGRAGRATGLHEANGGAVSAVASAATDSGVPVLLAALVALTLGAVAVRRSRRRSS